MALTEDIVGKHYRYPDYYEVEREMVREHAAATKHEDPWFFDEDAAAELGHSSLPAPLTFISILGYKAQLGFLEHVGIAVQDAKILQVDQEQKFFRPLMVGDKLYADVSAHSVRKAHGTDLLVMKTVITDQAGDIIQESYTTLAGRSEEDGESGFNDGSA